MSPVVVAAAAAVAGSIPLLWWAVAAGRTASRAASSNLVRVTAGTDLREALLARSATERTVRPAVAWLAGATNRLTPAGLLADLERRLVLAGRPAPWPLERVLAAKLLLGAGAVLLMLPRWLSLPGRSTLFFTIVLTVGFFMVPDLLLRAAATKRQRAMRERLPDTLDQIMICVEAGLGFEAAMGRAGKTGTGPLADELVYTLQEMRIGATRAQALRALIDRTEVPELRRFVLALLQAESFGMPIADVLRTQAAELRDRRRQHAEERAMKIPVKIVFPLVFCILPTLMILILGPAALRLARFFAGGGL